MNHDRMMTTSWRHRTIQQLENRDFGEPALAPTNMVRRCLELCKVPIEQFTVENLRLMIGQQFCLRYLIPLAIEQLEQDLFAEGDLYPGDLVEKVLNVDKDFWLAHKELWKKVNELIRDKRPQLAAGGIPTEAFDTAV